MFLTPGDIWYEFFILLFRYVPLAMTLNALNMIKSIQKVCLLLIFIDNELFMKEPWPCELEISENRILFFKHVLFYVRLTTEIKINWWTISECYWHHQNCNKILHKIMYSLFKYIHIMHHYTNHNIRHLFFWQHFVTHVA